MSVVAPSTYILWVDLESSGLDIQLDEIVEAAFILTDVDLTEIFETQCILAPTERGWQRLQDNRVVHNMHEKSGLLNTLMLAGPFGATPWQVQEDLFMQLLNNIGPGVRATAKGMSHDMFPDEVTLHLGGSGIAAFDRPMIKHWMPALDDILHYAPIDVGVLRRTWKMWTGNDITADQSVKTHRAMSDVRGHLAEARAFRTLFRSLADATDSAAAVAATQ